MIIDGVSINSLFGERVQFLDYKVSNPSLNMYITVSDGDRKKPHRRKSVGINNLIVRIAFHDTKDEAYIMASEITSRLGDAYVNFDSKITYRVVVATEGTINSIDANHLHEWTFQLQILDKLGDGVEVITTSANPITLVNEGTWRTPIAIEVTPTSSIASFSVYGFGVHTSSNPLVVNSPTINKKVIIDGDTCQVLQEVVGGYQNKFQSTNLMSFPEIPKGSSTLVFSPSNLNIRIFYNPRYI